MNSIKLSAIALTLLAVGSSQVKANNVFQLALFPPAQIVNEAEHISGLRLQIYGKNTDVKGVDLGIVNQSTGIFSGVALGGAQLVGGDFTGIGLGLIQRVGGNFKGIGLGLVQLTSGDVSGALLSPYGVTIIDGDAVGWVGGSIYCQTKGDVTGLQGGLVSRCGGKSVGWQGGLVALTEGDASGLVTGAYTAVGGHTKGVQLGIVNTADTMKGVQLGIVNVVNDAYGVQIGLWNYIGAKEKLRGFPIANGKF